MVKKFAASFRNPRICKEILFATVHSLTDQMVIRCPVNMETPVVCGGNFIIISSSKNSQCKSQSKLTQLLNLSCRTHSKLSLLPPEPLRVNYQTFNLGVESVSPVRESCGGVSNPWVHTRFSLELHGKG